MVVRMRSTRSHTRNRRSHHALRAGNFGKCSNCGKVQRAHTVCMSCGFYKGQRVLDLVKKAEKKSRRLKEKESGSRS